MIFARKSDPETGPGFFVLGAKSDPKQHPKIMKKSTPKKYPKMMPKGSKSDGTSSQYEIVFLESIFGTWSNQELGGGHPLGGSIFNRF